MIFKINISSIVDIITNSSSEIFTIKTDKTREFVADMINSFCLHNRVEYKLDLADLDVNVDNDWEFQEAVETLKKFGYKAVKDDSPNSAIVLEFDDHYTFQGQEDLFRFLRKELNAEYDRS